MLQVSPFMKPYMRKKHVTTQRQVSVFLCHIIPYLRPEIVTKSVTNDQPSQICMEEMLLIL